MKKTNFEFRLLSKEKRRFYIEEIIRFFSSKRWEEIGVIASEEILDFFLENLSKEIYNKWIDDTYDLMKKGFEDLEIDLEVIKKK